MRKTIIRNLETNWKQDAAIVENKQEAEQGYQLITSFNNFNSIIFSLDKNSRQFIHMNFVFLNLIAVWLDENKEVIYKEVITPWMGLIEAPKNSKWLIETQEKFDKEYGFGDYISWT